MFRVVVTNAVLSNTGDAAILQAIAESLREVSSEAVELTCLDAHASVTRRLYPTWNVEQQPTVAPQGGRVMRAFSRRIRRGLASRIASGRRWPLIVARAWPFRQTSFARALRAIESADVVVSSGGTYLVDHYNFDHRATELAMVKALGKPVLLWTQSLGPFRSAQSRKAATHVASSVEAVWVRDRPSQAAWATLKTGPSATIAPDAVFSLTRDRPLFETRPKRALLSVREWSATTDGRPHSLTGYKPMLRASAERLIEEGFDVHALSTCQGVPSYRYDDSEVALDTFRSLDVRVNRDFHTPNELIEIIGASRVAIATRMHFSIMALLTGTPVVAIAYEFKTLELFRSVGLGDFVLPIEESNAEWLTDRVAALLRDPASAILSSGTLGELRSRALSPAGYVRDLVGDVTP